MLFHLFKVSAVILDQRKDLWWSSLKLVSGRCSICGSVSNELIYACFGSPWVNRVKCTFTWHRHPQILLLEIRCILQLDAHRKGQKCHQVGTHTFLWNMLWLQFPRVLAAILNQMRVGTITVWSLLTRVVQSFHRSLLSPGVKAKSRSNETSSSQQLGFNLKLNSHFS